MLTDLWKPLLLVTVVLVLPLALLAFWGEPLGAQIEQWRDAPPPKWALTTTVVALLASDVFLPIPSGPLCTLAGSVLGVWLGTAAGCVGMTLGAAIAFAMARRWGRSLAERFASPKRLAELETACRAHGPWMLVVTRPLPVAAEACALLVGALQMRWQAFLPAVLVSNLVLAAAYAALGQQAEQRGWLPAALCVSVALPLVAAWAWGRKRA